MKFVIWTVVILTLLILGCLNNESNIGKIMVLIEEAKEKQDPSICGKIGDHIQQEMCYTDVALALNDSSICENIHEDSKHVCYQDFASRYDPSICDEKLSSTQSKDSCYSYVAGARQEPLFCEKITQQSIKDSCYLSTPDYHNPDPAVCGKMMDETWRDKCYKSTAKKLADPSLCEKIQNDSLKEICFWGFT
ncbi:hypothetical protein ACFLRC_00615 [Candidatus Altiarchaeota archaeon]